MIAKTKSEIENLRKAGELLSEVLHAVAAITKPGVSTAELDIAAEKMIRERGCVPAFLNYDPGDAAYPYPAALCVSIDDEVVHGIPSEKRIIKNGDLVMLDLGLSYNGYFSDMATMVCVGDCDTKTRRLIDATREAMSAAVTAAKVGSHIGDIGAAIEKVARKYGYGVVEELGGHSLGKKPHEQPFVPNVGRSGTGERIVEGLVLALEPIFTEGKSDVYLGRDQWTYYTADHSRSAEFEQTIIVTAKGPEILTPLQ